MKNIARKIQVLIIGPTPPPYHGVSVMTQALLDSDLKKSFRLLYLDLTDRRGLQYVNKPDLYDVFLFLKQWTYLLKMLIRERPEVTYIPICQTKVGFIRDSLLIWSASFFRSRVVAHLHGGNFRVWYEGSAGWVKLLIQKTLKRVARVVVLGESFRSLFEGLVTREKISVVPNGIQWSKDFQPNEEKFLKKRPFRILYIGSLSRSKGTPVLLAAIPFVIRDRKEVEFIFAGTWPRVEEQHEAESFIHQHGLAPYTQFTGHVDGEKKQALFESADLLVFSGVQQEGQPLVVIEAMAAGLPVVATDRGCLRETVVDGVTGLIVPPNSPEDIAKQLIRLIESPSLRKEMAIRGRERFETQYTLTKFAAGMERVFLETCKLVER